MPRAGNSYPAAGFVGRRQDHQQQDRLRHRGRLWQRQHLRDGQQGAETSDVGTSVSAITPTLDAGSNYTYITYGFHGRDPHDAPAREPGRGRCQQGQAAGALNLAPDAGALDIYLTSASTCGLESDTVFATNLLWRHGQRLHPDQLGHLPCLRDRLQQAHRPAPGASRPSRWTRQERQHADADRLRRRRAGQRHLAGAKGRCQEASPTRKAACAPWLRCLGVARSTRPSTARPCLQVLSAR